MKSASEQKAACPLRSHCCRSMWNRASSVRARFVGVEHDVVADRYWPAKSRTRRGPSAGVSRMIRCKQPLGIVEQSPRFRPADRVVEDLRIFALQSPRP